MRSQHRKATLNIPTVLDLQNPEWDVILKSWAYINVKNYELTINKGSIVNKKIMYLNLKEEPINYKVCSNMPNIIEVKTETINLQKDCKLNYIFLEKDYIKLQIKAPLTPCKLHVKIALMDIKGDTVYEGMEFDLIIANLTAK
ncbi:unnamed protein product (macronuclear) [Paramecium tetraurelia]|uniref:Uncharacterized protein n=1 Tax=Paramecium tetraurelia TaxID=5888 RepID=A0CVA0_PARTE|nr:uncharacterized protein GSPATT00010885001 [Paramecium tetraurelia]CAK74717.1 unnamed protein product [Paramecium tetraurelia]|eukprot:XP_001442114.1 hypothetical protein (macronuclear) [Paramecium tetraurelia strain d4-2]